jgi:hypothetical protein
MVHLLEYTIVTIVVLFGLTPLWLNRQKRGKPNRWWVITALLGKKMDSNHACVQCHPESQYTEQIESHTHH